MLAQVSGSVEDDAAVQHLDRDANTGAILDLPSKVWYGALHQGGFGVRASDVKPAKEGSMFLSPQELHDMGARAKVADPSKTIRNVSDTRH